MDYCRKERRLSLLQGESEHEADFVEEPVGDWIRCLDKYPRYGATSHCVESVNYILDHDYC